MDATTEIMSNLKVLNELLEGKKQVRENNTRPLKDVAHELGINFNF